MDRVHAVQDALDDVIGALSPTRAAAGDIRDIERQIEELRVSLWAQQLGTAAPGERATDLPRDRRHRTLRSGTYRCYVGT